MVDKPARVTHMVADWFRENDCQEAMFNLKLPMKKRYAEAVHNIESGDRVTRDLGGTASTSEFTQAIIDRL